MSTLIAPLKYRLRPYSEEHLPESDGAPMAETDVHRAVMMDLLDALEDYFRDDPQVYVTGNIFVYYRGDDSKLHPVSPDVFVVRGIEKKLRPIYHIEKEGKGPEMVIEVTSKSTKKEDLRSKRHIYARLGVKEYFLFDPLGDTLRPVLRGYRLQGDDYVPMMGAVLKSEVLGLELQLKGKELRLYNPATGEQLLTRAENHADRRAARAEILAERERAKAERKKTKAAEEKAEAEQKKAEALKTENDRLREELARLRGKNL